MTRLVLGLLCGALLCGLRLPLGAELLEIPAAPAAEAYVVRALGLAVVAIVVILSRKSFDGRPNADLLLAVSLGCLAEGLLGDLRREATSAPFAFVPIALVALVLRERRGPAATSEPQPSSTPLPAIFLAGAGSAIGLEGLARPLRLLGAGLAVDDSVFAFVLLSALAYGGIAFGSALRSGGRDRATGETIVPASLVAGAAFYVGLIALRGITTPTGLRGVLARFGLDASRYGQLPTDALLGAIVFVLPGFAIGTALYCARRRAELATWLSGAAAGLAFVPRLLVSDAALDERPYSTGLVPLSAALIGVSGLLTVAARGRDASARGPLATLAGAATLMLLALFVPVQQVTVRQAWTRFPTAQRAVFETPEGQFIVEPGPPGVERVTLDHRELAPGAEGARADAERLRTSLALLDQAVRAEGASVLLVGTLTPGRSLVLREGGAVRIDRCAAWEAVQEPLEALLFEGHTDALPPAGECLGLTAARRALRAGDYDLVVVPPVPGRVPLVPNARLPEGTVAVAWYDAGSYVARRRIERPIVLSADGFEHLAIGVVYGIDPPLEPIPDRPAVVAAGRPIVARSVFGWLATRVDERPVLSRADLAARLSRANEDNSWSPLTRGLAAHYAAQRRSSPWETRAQRTELAPESLVELSHAAALGQPDLFTRELWNGLAEVLVGKRDVPAIFEWVEPVAATWPPWPELELALAHAELESLDPESAAARLALLVAARPDDIELATILGQAHTMAGDTAAAVELWRTFERRRPGERRVRRALAIALFADGQADLARPLARELLDADPDDRELFELFEADGAQDEGSGE